MPGLLEKRLTQEEKFHSDEGKKNNTKNSKKDRNFASKEFSKEESDYSKTQKMEDSYMTEEDITELEELEALVAEEEFQKESRKRHKTHRFFLILLTAASIYLIMLIYGVIITEYRYNEKGKVEPITLTVEDITNKNEYISVLGMYLQARTLYEEILTLDYRIAAGVEDTLSVAPEYETVLDSISSLTVQIEAATFSSKYNQVKNMLQTWVQTHAAAYCQYMSAAISKNDSNAAAEAIAARDVVESQFQLVTQNMITFGTEISGYNLTDIKNWDPNNYVQSAIEGIN